MQDPYANAFLENEEKLSPHCDDKTEMKKGTFERKFEIDSLGAVLKLVVEYYKIMEGMHH